MEQFEKNEFLSNKDACVLLYESIKEGRSFFAGRIGGTEIKTICTYDHPIQHIKDFRVYTNTICELSGFFPKSVFQIKKFCELYKDASKEIDYFGKWDWDSEEEYLKNNCTSVKKRFSAKVYDPCKQEFGWYRALEGKNVLVIHPFSESIEKQYKNNREKIAFKDGTILPLFNLTTIKAVQSLGGKGALGFNTWFDALDYMKSEIDKIEFDVALLGCGAYGIPLGAYIKRKNKQAVYIGGHLQLYFGIMGSRWEHDDFVNKCKNSYWIRPSESERIDNYKIVEGGCYW